MEKSPNSILRVPKGLFDFKPSQAIPILKGWWDLRGKPEQRSKPIGLPSGTTYMASRNRFSDTGTGWPRTTVLGWLSTQRMFKFWSRA